MSFVFRPGQFAQAITPAISIALAVAGTLAIGVEVFVSHPEVLRFSREGRWVVGEVQKRPLVAARDRWGRGVNRPSASVDDPELGPQAVDVWGDWRGGERVPVRCLTSAGHCLDAAYVKSCLDAWPLTPQLLGGVAAFVLGAALMTAGQGGRRRRRRAGNEASAPAE